MRISSIIVLASIAIFALGSEGPYSSSSANHLDYTIEVKMKEAVASPVVCDGRKQNQAGWDSRTISLDGRVDLSVSVKGAEDIPLTYRYEVSGGRMIGQGADVKWDLLDVAPGDYSVTITVDDGIGGTGRTVKSVRVLPSRGCPCSCPAISIVSHFTQIRPGETADFEVWVHGGTFSDDIEYHWTVKNGSIIQGQNTASIKVNADGALGEFVTATVQIGGVDRNCMCAQAASESVRIGSETKTLEIPLMVQGIHVDGATLYVDCPRGSIARRDSRSSYDLIANLNVFVVSNSVYDKVSFKYAVTGGQIIGSGPTVNWDLSGFQPGIYSVSIEVRDGKAGPPVERKATVTLEKRECMSLCPDVGQLLVRGFKDSGDLIIFADVDAAPETSLVWSTKGAKILAGFGSRSIRLRPTKDDATVTLNLEPLAEPGCPRAYTRRLKTPD